MRILKIMLMTIILGVLAVPLLSCASESGSESLSENQVVTVQRGDLTIDITAVGNLAFSLKENPTFEIAGTVEEVLVEEGDAVEEGQVLAKLDTSEWEANLAALEDQLTVKERDILQMEVNLKNAEIALAKAQDTYTWPELEIAQADVEEAEAHLQYAVDRRAEAGADVVTWDQVIKRYSATLEAAEKRLNAMLTGADPEEVAIKKLQVEIAQGKLEGAQKDVEDAQEALNEAKETSLEVSAPFAGLITTVNVSTGDVVNKGRVAAILADPTKFEAEILVNEIDIFNIRLGAQASIQLEAMPTIVLPAKVTYISPTATIQQGVVNYKVRVEIESFTPLESLALSEEEEQPQTMPGGIDEAFDKAVEEGRISQEQADMMKERFGQMAGSFSQEQIEQFIERFGQGGRGFSQGQTEQFRERSEQGPGMGQRPEGMILQVFELREGLTVTVSVIVQGRSDVLLVPNGAITGSGRQTYVRVVSLDGVITERSIMTGISDWQYTEVTDGLSEGEKVVIPETGTTTTTPTTPQQGGQGGMRIPGMGGFGR